MSELKAINAYRLTTNTEDSDVFIHNDEFGCGGDLAECYLKSEADKVIEELELQLAKAQLVLRLNEPKALYSNLEIMSRLNHKIDVVERRELHQKYKRCLAMASKCRLRARWFGDNAFYKKEQWALQWHRRWLELAEKFKEAK